MDRQAALLALKSLAGREKLIRKFIDEAHRATVRICDELNAELREPGFLHVSDAGFAPRSLDCEWTLEVGAQEVISVQFHTGPGVKEEVATLAQCELIADGKTLFRFDLLSDAVRGVEWDVDPEALRVGVLSALGTRAHEGSKRLRPGQQE